MNKLESNKAQKIRQIFSSIADNYDRANRAITLGLDRGWRKKLVEWSEAPATSQILDCATGTGAVAFEFQRHLSHKAQITGVDFCEQMLKKAQEVYESSLNRQKPHNDRQKPHNDRQKPHNDRQKSSFGKKNIHFQLADVEALPFSDNSFDVCSMAYGLRNMAEPVQALKEMARVTKPGGKVMILETGDQPFWLLSPFFHIYFRYVVPFVGGWITGKKTAYQYLQQSSGHFPSREGLLALMEKSGAFEKSQYRTLFFGASFLYKAYVKI